jgi:putative inorganic carbon (hco3(-)) transporter
MSIPTFSHAGNGQAPSTASTKTPGLNLLLVFVISWFLHLGARLPFLGAIRFDLILVVILTAFALANRAQDKGITTRTDTLLRVLVVYAILTIPFVEWPGSVIKNGIPEFIKAIVFYYFVIAFVRTESDLRKFIVVFLGCQVIRIVEPLYLHFTEDYWGEIASMSNWEYLNRLSGAPSDVINPNGLAFVICTVLPFLYFLKSQSWFSKLAFFCLTPVCLYTLSLTGSRTGFLALIVILLGVLAKSKRRFVVGFSIAILAIACFPLLSEDMQDRYLSTFGAGEKNEGTAEGRVEGVKANFLVAMRKPIVGHGLGTSREANANFGLEDKPSHNLYAEVAQELGFVGLAIFLLLLKSIFSAFSSCRRAYRGAVTGGFLPSVLDAMQVWLWMNFLFSFASYGLHSYEWYLLAGFSVVLQRLHWNAANLDREDLKRPA